MHSRRTFLSLAAGAATLAACGRQFTPDPGVLSGNNDLAGKMVIRFRVRGTLDFTNISYVIAFNTSGTGVNPYPQAYLTKYTDFSYAFAVGASYGGPEVTLPSLFQYIVTADGGLNPRPVSPSPSLTQLVPQDNSLLNEFQLTFTREQLDNPLEFDTPSPSPVSSATASASPSADPSASATPAPTLTPTSPPNGFAPTSSPIPNARPTTNAQRYWFINFFTLDRSGVPLDSLGIGGATDASYVAAYDTAVTKTNPVYRASGILAPPTDLSAYIDGGEIDNYA